MNIYPTIEALLHYANTHLLFDELDFIYARNRLMQMLALTDYEEYEISGSEIEEMTSPAEIVDTLVNYAVMQKIITEEKRSDFAKQILDCVLKRPSEIADIFQTLPTSKGFDWLYDYAVKSGYIRSINKKWEAKSTKGKLEVIYTGCCGCCEKEKKSAYPECKFCLQNEGFGRNLNMRSVPLELGGERMFFYYKKRALVQSEGIVVSEYHRPLAINATSLDKMFDFVSLMPGWFIAAREDGHERYTTGARLAPLSKAADKTRFKSTEYPYINITVIDWYFGAVRLLCTNREKLIEYAGKLIGKWCGAGSREVAVCVRKVESQYCIEIMLLEKGHKPASECCGLCGFDDVLPLMGSFGISGKKEEQLKQIERFVTKQERFSPAKLDGDMAENADMINRLLHSVGSSKPSELEASLEVKDEVGRTFENALIALYVPIDELHGNF